MKCLRKGRRWFAGSLLAALLLAACGKHGGDRPKPITSTITILTRLDAIDPAVLLDFQNKFGILVQVRPFANNDDLAGLLSAPGSHFDLAMPSSFDGHQLLAAGMLARLHKDQLPNLAGVDRGAFPVGYDPDNDYVIPYEWGSVGIAYDENAVEGLPKSWADLFRHFDPAKSRGGVALIDSPRYGLGTALVFLGFSPNTDNLAEIDRAGDLVMGVRDEIRYIDTDHAVDDLLHNKVAMAVAWGPQIAKAMREKKTLRLSLPKEGSIIFRFCFAIPRNAANPAGAEALVNFLLQPEIAARVTNYSFCPTTVKAATPFVDRFIYNGPAYFRNPADKNYYLDDVTDAAAREYERVWDKLAAPYRGQMAARPVNLGASDGPAVDPP